MKKMLVVSLVLLVVLVGCLRKSPQNPTPKQPQAEPQPEASATEPASPDPAPPQNKAETPDGAAELLLESISSLNQDKIDELIGQYFGGQTIPSEYISLLEPIAGHVTYKIGESRIDGDKAEVDIAVTSLDAQSAINSVMPGAVAHLAAMQLTGKDVSNPEKILTEYAAKNIKWDKTPTIKTDCTLYLVKGADGEWKADASNPDNLGFANAISGGAVEVANSLKAFADKYK